MTQIFALTQRNDDQRGWLHLQQQDVNADWECLAMTMQSLDGMVDAALIKQARHPKAGFSFSFPRSAAEFMAMPLDGKQPTADEVKAMLPGYSLTFLMPIAAPPDGYSPPEIEGTSWNIEALAPILAAAHAHNVPQGAVEAALAAYAEQVAETQENLKRQDKQLISQVKQRL